MWQHVKPVCPVLSETHKRGVFKRCVCWIIHPSFFHYTLQWFRDERKDERRDWGREQDRGVGACGVGMAGVCRALVSPEGNGASSSPPGFLFTRRVEESCSLYPPGAITEDTGLKSPNTKPPPSNFWRSHYTRPDLVVSVLWFIERHTNRIGSGVRMSIGRQKGDWQCIY